MSMHGCKKNVWFYQISDHNMNLTNYKYSLNSQVHIFKAMFGGVLWHVTCFQKEVNESMESTSEEKQVHKNEAGKTAASSH